MEENQEKKIKNKSPTKKQVKNLILTDLLNQLEKNGKHDKFYLDLVNDYMFFWELKYTLQKDIKANKLRYDTKNGNGIVSSKPNESIQNLIKVNQQMLKILDDLNLQEPSLPIGGGKTHGSLLQRN